MRHGCLSENNWWRAKKTFIYVYLSQAVRLIESIVWESATLSLKLWANSFNHTLLDVITSAFKSKFTSLLFFKPSVKNTVHGVVRQFRSSASCSTNDLNMKSWSYYLTSDVLTMQCISTFFTNLKWDQISSYVNMLYILGSSILTFKPNRISVLQCIQGRISTIWSQSSW